MSDRIHLAVDAMGGDHGPRLCVLAAVSFLRAHPDSRITLVGDQPSLESELPPGYPRDRCHLLHAGQVVSMSDKPSQALRHKRDSSLWRAIELVAGGDAQAVVSAGNTGALMAIASYQLKTLAGIGRPAIGKTIPTATGASVMLDMGANINCSARQLAEFAVMGAAMSRIGGVTLPRVALLNVGVEATKGNHAIREAAAILAEAPGMEFTGFIEGDSLYSGGVDVVVCDGFTGNVALKVSEGVARYLLTSLQQAFRSGLLARAAGLLARPVLRHWVQRFSPSRYNGAPLLGLNGVVVKSHGSADQPAFEQALKVALEQVENDMPRRIARQIEQTFAAEAPL